LLHTKERVVGRDIVPAFWQDLGGGKILQGAQNVDVGSGFHCLRSIFFFYP